MTNPETNSAAILAAAIVMIEEEHESCPYCGSDQVEHIDAVDTSDWTSEVEKWGCKMPSCKDRTFRICYAVEREFRGVRVDTDKFKTLHRPAPIPEPTLASHALEFVRIVDRAALLSEVRAARAELEAFANDPGNKATARTIARALRAAIKEE
jgi:hypothetical protein